MGLLIPTALKNAEWHPSGELPPGFDATVLSAESGVAPFNVNFRAGYQPSKGGTELSNFHTYLFQWDFGDPTSGTWPVSGKSKNTDTGPIASHVYYEPGTYEATFYIIDLTGHIYTNTYTITIADPDTYFAGNNTICVSSTGNFTGAPTGALEVTTTDLTTIASYAVADRRILLRRGDTWSLGTTPAWPNTRGVVHIGAYGTGTSPNEQGLYSNAPQITITGNSFCALDQKHDWTFYGLRFVDTTYAYGTFGGTTNMQRISFFDLDIEGFNVCLGWSHYNDSELLTIEDMAVVNCHMRDGNTNCVYIGSEQLTYMGNIVYDCSTSHVTRIWQNYRGLIKHNRLSGSSIDNLNGRQALKLHGPGDKSASGGDTEYGTPVPGTPLLGNHTEQVVVSDNVFGQSGPWPVSIGPQDNLDDVLMYDIIFEKNRLITNYGTYNNRDVTIPLHIYASFVSIRNNVFDGSNGGNDYTALVFGGSGQINDSYYGEVYNNTIYRSDNSFGNNRYGMEAGSASHFTTLRNNLISFPGSTVATAVLIDNGADTVSSNNQRIDDPLYVDATNIDPLLRDFSLDTGSTAEDAGVHVDVFDDFNGDNPINNPPNLGAFN